MANIQEYTTDFYYSNHFINPNNNDIFKIKSNAKGGYI